MNVCNLYDEGHLYITCLSNITLYLQREVNYANYTYDYAYIIILEECAFCHVKLNIILIPLWTLLV